jgi:Amt family ammonium transporter
MTWNKGGWMSSFREDYLVSNCGVVDFGGGGVVHMTGGIAALIGAYMVGPRIGRFGPNGEVRSIPQLSWVYQTIGTLILWFGWYGFNGMSSVYIVGNGLITAKVMVNSTIAASISCISSLLVAYLTMGFIDPDAVNNGVIGGLAAITGACGVVEPEGAVLIGFIAGFIYQGGKLLLLKLRIDDVINASPVHFLCAVWGMLATGLLAEETNYGLYYYTERQHECCGAFYGCGGNLLGAQTIFVLVDIAWTGTTVFAMFIIAKYTVGLRVSEEIEILGMDSSKHGGLADYVPNLVDNSNLVPAQKTASYDLVP